MRTPPHRLAIVSVVSIVPLALAGCVVSEGDGESPSERITATSAALSAADAVTGTVVVDANNLSDPPGQMKLFISTGGCQDDSGRTIIGAKRPPTYSFVGIGKVDVTKNCEFQIAGINSYQVLGTIFTQRGKILYRNSDTNSLGGTGNVVTFDRAKLPKVSIDTRGYKSKAGYSRFVLMPGADAIDVTNRAVTFWVAGGGYGIESPQGYGGSLVRVGQMGFNYGGKLTSVSGEAVADGPRGARFGNPFVDPCPFDNVPPVAMLVASPAVLPVPNHKMVAITLTKSATDACDKSPKTTCTVTANEPVNMIGSGNTAPDIEWVGDQLYLRAERSGMGTDRVYTITCTTTDASGNAAKATATVKVPHDSSDNKGATNGSKLFCDVCNCFSVATGLRSKLRRRVTS